MYDEHVKDRAEGSNPEFEKFTKVMDGLMALA
jgi:hypothetical protein